MAFLDDFLRDMYDTPDAAFMQAVLWRMGACRPIDPGGADRADAALWEAFNAMPEDYQAKHRAVMDALP